MNFSPTAIWMMVVCLLLLVVIAGVKPAHSRTVNACTTVNVPVSKPCATTVRKIHGFTVTVKVCK